MNAIRKVLSSDSDKHAGSTADSTGASRSSIGSTHGTTTGTHGTAGTHGTTTGASTGLTGGNEGHQLPVHSGVTGRAEETDRGANRTVGGTHSGDFTDPHEHGHSHNSKVANEFDPRGATTTHHHTHLGHKTHETRQTHETEEVERIKDHERHVTHVQHHVQPVKDTEHRAEVHHQRAIPQTHIEERHVSSDQDKKAFAGLQTHQDRVVEAPKERTVVDLGEKVNETVHHHVHNVIQPIIHKDTHEHHKIHTVIPTHHVTHEAPIVHQSVEHGMLSKDDFVKQGGVLGSKTTHENADVLATGDCERNVDGVGEQLARELNLRSGTLSGQHKGDTRI